MIENIVEEIAHTLGSYAYLLVGVMAFLETAFFMGLVAPGEFSIVLGGVLAGEGSISVYVLIGVVWACAFAGDSTSFLLGRRFGRAFILKHGRKLRITDERLAQVERYFQQHGGKTILVGRFIGIVRAMAPFIAGASKMPYRNFLPYDVLGTGLWGTAFVLLGYFFWQSFEQVVEIAGRGTFGFGVIVFLIVAVIVARRRLRDPEKRMQLRRKAQAAAASPPLKQVLFLVSPVWRFILRPLWRKVLRPGWRAIEPEARFLFDRITPGGLGLEFTSLLASAAVGIYIVALYLSLLSNDVGPTPGDVAAADVAHGLRAGWHTELLKVITWLGSAEVVIPIVVVAAAIFIWRKFFIEASILLAGTALMWMSVTLIKGWIERPRPDDALIGEVGFGFPSGHAVFSTVYLAIAILAVRAGLGPWSGTAVVTVAVAFSAAVGLTRLYLGVHYLSDITSGWALGLSLFAVCGMVGLMVGYLRNHRKEGEG